MLRLLQTLFPLLPKTTSSSLRTNIRKTILSDIRTANLRTKNHKLNRVVQAMLFGMIERGMDAEVVGDKGKARATGKTSGTANSGEEAMWAIVLTKELWRKGIWCLALSAFLSSSILIMLVLQERSENRLHCCAWLLPPFDQGTKRFVALLLR